MKKLFFFLSIGILALTFTSCETEKDKAYKMLNEVCKQIKSEMSLPNQIDEITLLEDIELNGHNMVYKYTIQDTEDGELLDYLQDNLAEFKDTIRESLRDSNEVMDGIVPLLKKSECNLIYHYTSSTTGKSFEVVFTPEDISRL